MRAREKEGSGRKRVNVCKWVVPLVLSGPFFACAHTGNEMVRLNKYSKVGFRQTMGQSACRAK